MVAARHTGVKVAVVIGGTASKASQAPELGAAVVVAPQAGCGTWRRRATPT